jgi:hypothetical protein
MLPKHVDRWHTYMALDTLGRESRKALRLEKGVFMALCANVTGDV